MLNGREAFPEAAPRPRITGSFPRKLDGAELLGAPLRTERRRSGPVARVRNGEMIPTARENVHRGPRSLRPSVTPFR